MRIFVARQHWSHKDMRYEKFYEDKAVPTPHTSGYWEHGFQFDNDYFLQLAVL